MYINCICHFDIGAVYPLSKTAPKKLPPHRSRKPRPGNLTGP